MKKYFLFDDEPISGGSYVQRMLIQTFLMFVLIGFWLLAATGYKRAGTFGWRKEYRIIAAILIPILAISNALSRSEGYSNLPFNLFDIFAFLAGTFHSVMLFKNGNKRNYTQLPTEILNEDLIKEFDEINIKTKFDNYGNLDLQLIGNLLNSAKKSIMINQSKYTILFKDEKDNYIASDILPSKIFNENSKYYIKSGVLTYTSNIPLSPEKFEKITKCSIEDFR